jgi:type IV pilus assembly protein PilC
MIAVGEETGETSVILSKLADFYENEVSEATKNLASVIEPVLMVFIGIVVGFFAVSMIQPMYSMMDAIN